ncbi:MAG: sigma-70 family RNA polymerase sigma factor [Verrucomicrobiae bacterium]|nr:sigma-70 family RNA polymerase sigma factor [Verrucomicrobiae bacterium]
MNDQELIQRYSSTKDAAAFGEIVARHAGLVLSVAIRKTGNRELGEDVAQQVFVILSRKAAQLGRHPAIAAWLHRVTVFEAAKALDSEKRRQLRHRAYAQQLSMNYMNYDAPDEWERALPLLDNALNALPTKDRTVILLRFYEKKSHREIARLLGKSEEAIRMMASRALGKLSKMIKSKGVAITASSLTAGFGSKFVETASANVCLHLSKHAIQSTTNTHFLLGQVIQMPRITLGLKSFAVVFVALISIPSWFIGTSFINSQSSTTDSPGTTTVPERNVYGSDPDKRYTLQLEWENAPWNSHLIKVEESPSFSMFDDSRKLRPITISYASIATDEVPQIEGALERLWQEASRLSNEHTYLDPLRDDSALEVLAFRVAPFDASELLQSFLHQIEDIIGPERTVKLLSTFAVHSYFGAFGRLEVLAQVHKKADSTEVFYEQRIPATGKCVNRGNSPLDLFEYFNGKVAKPKPADAAIELAETEASMKGQFAFLGKDLKMTTQAIELIGISSKESALVQNRIEEWFAVITKIAQSHTIEQRAPDGTIGSFKIEPFPEESDSTISDLTQDLTNMIGAESCDLFLNHFPFDNYFAAFGQHRVEVTFKEERSVPVSYSPRLLEPGFGIWAQFVEIDPVTAKPTRSGYTDYKNFTDRYGSFLEIETSSEKLESDESDLSDLPSSNEKEWEEGIEISESAEGEFTRMPTDRGDGEPVYMLKFDDSGLLPSNEEEWGNGVSD